MERAPALTAYAAAKPISVTYIEAAFIPSRPLRQGVLLLPRGRERVVRCLGHLRRGPEILYLFSALRARLLLYAIVTMNTLFLAKHTAFAVLISRIFYLCDHWACIGAPLCVCVCVEGGDISWFLLRKGLSERRKVCKVASRRV